MYNSPFDRLDDHPVLMSARQIAANQILLTYDRRADLNSAVRLSNYWIRSNAGTNSAASVNMGDALTASNAIRPDMAMITPADNSGMHFLMTFRSNIPPRTFYIVLPCFVNLEGGAGFNGENWGPFSMNMFIGM
ncbi:hypothetical protein [Paenibacillus glycanilyticus]|uniref:Uncharacterized protein n=1 Tax=Paenibacillus glycanilyticus TaxID=126569 RepID=A0ABQ6NLB6_9BACL|nr:hypothetical protein [Paenibacillus glycanilyticus]GMK45876.1 hypothetical protein PghCCS26_30040 [Paenibacillus glycanilyticus]